MTPKRIQLKRSKGWRISDYSTNYVICDRRGKWGNPFNWTTYPAIVNPASLDGDSEPIHVAVSERKRWAAVDFKNALLYANAVPKDYPSIEEIRAELAGKDLACWCDLAADCHVDTLLLVANGGGS